MPSRDKSWIYVCLTFLSAPPPPTPPEEERLFGWAAARDDAEPAESLPLLPPFGFGSLHDT
jgi:hypothetical protein